MLALSQEAEKLTEMTEGVSSKSVSSAQAKERAESVSSSSTPKIFEEDKPSIPNLNLKRRALQRKVQNRPLMSGPIANLRSSDTRQRILSARQQRQKSLQNQLSVALQQNAELLNENRLFKTLHRRQDNALSKYENSASELPNIIKSHADEMRVWQTKCRALNVENRELNRKVLQKDKMLNELGDRVKHLNNLCAEKNLEERETLTQKVISLERKLDEKDEEIRLLTRRNTLEAKNFKTQLANERKKFREMTQKQMHVKSFDRTSSSHGSDHSSAKETKLGKVIGSIKATPAIGDETPPYEMMHDDDDDDLVIRPIVDKDTQTEQKESYEKIVKQLSDIQLFGSKKAQNIHNIQQKIQKDIEKNEAFLDLHSNEMSRDTGANSLTKNVSNEKTDEQILKENTAKPWDDLLSFTNEASKDSVKMQFDRPKPRAPSNLPRFNINMASQPTKRTPIDAQKKNKLLAQIKSIDTNGSP